MDESDYGDAAGLQAYADDLRATFMRIQDQGVELHAQARAVQVRETSRDGLVTVTVGSRGELVGLDINPRVFRRPDARALADSIITTVAQAAAKAQERVIEVFAPLVPADQMRSHLDGDLEAVMSQLAEQMGGRR